MINDRRLKIALLAFFLFFITAFSNNNFPVPQGWKLPEPADLKGDWRNESSDRFAVVAGDFNGDGVQDTARLLVREDDFALGLFAFVSQEDGSLKSYLLDELDDKIVLNYMGIEKVSPGKYQTACGKGYWACGQGEVPQINIKNDAVNYFASEGANSFFYWDNKTNNFKRIWISD